MAGRPKKQVALSQTELHPVDQLEIGAAADLLFIQQRSARKRALVLEADAFLEQLRKQRRDRKFDGAKTEEEWDREIARAENDLESAEHQHKTAQEAALKWERAIAPEKRGEGEKITQDEAAKMLTNCALHWRLGWEQLLTRLCQESPLCRTANEAEERFRPLMTDCLESKIEAAILDGKIALWAAKALREGM